MQLCLLNFTVKNMCLFNCSMRRALELKSKNSKRKYICTMLQILHNKYVNMYVQICCIFVRFIPQKIVVSNDRVCLSVVDIDDGETEETCCPETVERHQHPAGVGWCLTSAGSEGSHHSYKGGAGLAHVLSPHHTAHRPRQGIFQSLRNECRTSICFNQKFHKL